MMSTKHSVWATAVGCIGLVLFLRYTANSHPHSTGHIQQQKTLDCMPLYIRRGNPLGRVSTAKRSSKEALPTIAVLAPDLTGLTMQEQPTLYWYLSALTTYPIELVIQRGRSPSPLLKTDLPSPRQPGMQRVRLADYDKHLEPATTYKWTIALILDPKKSSQNPVATGFIEVESIEILEKGIAKANEAEKQRLMERVELLMGLSLEVARSSKDIHPHLYARAGLWYDALSAISELIMSGSQNGTFRQQRAFLLEQVGMPKEVITFDLLQNKE